MFPLLAGLGNDKLMSYVLIAMVQGGFRILDALTPEYIGDWKDTMILTDPQMDHFHADYIYIKRLDGAVQWRETYAQHASDEYGEENMGWRFTQAS